MEIDPLPYDGVWDILAKTGITRAYSPRVYSPEQTAQNTVR